MSAGRLQQQHADESTNARLASASNKISTKSISKKKDTVCNAGGTRTRYIAHHPLQSNTIHLIKKAARIPDKTTRYTLHHGPTPPAGSTRRRPTKWAGRRRQQQQLQRVIGPLAQTKSNQCLLVASEKLTQRQIKLHMMKKHTPRAALAPSTSHLHEVQPCQQVCVLADPGHLQLNHGNDLSPPGCRASPSAGSPPSLFS